MDLTVPTIRIGTWMDACDLAVKIGGPNPSLSATDVFSEAHCGKLEMVEKPHLGELIQKLTRPGQRKPFLILPPEPTLKQAAE